MKRLLVLNYEFPPLGGGASPVSYEIAKRLADSGRYDVDVVTMHYHGLPKIEEVTPRFRIHRVRCLRSQKAISHPWEQLTYIVSAYWKCRQLLRQHQYVACHCHFIIPTGWVARRLLKRLGLRYIITSHGSDVLGYNPRFRLLYPLLVRSWKAILDDAKHIVTPSHFLGNVIRETHSSLPSDHLSVIPNGISTHAFRPLLKRHRILVVSRLVKAKGVQDILQALHTVDLGDWIVDIVGDGPERPQLEELAQYLPNKHSVRFLGWIDNTDNTLAELYGDASVFILASHFENLNTTLLEAMQSGCAVIATDTGGNPEVLGEAGVLVSPRQPSEITHALQELIHNKKHRVTLQRLAIKRVRHYFRWDAIIEGYERLIEEQ